MVLDDELCLCFHVTRRKVQNFLRIKKPRRASLMYECESAGTGCGWCRGALQKLFEASQKGLRAAEHADLPDPEKYAADRSRYVKAGGGTPPPGATPVNP
jgi:bacterioferritin-associated ferredoxin